MKLMDVDIVKKFGEEAINEVLRLSGVKRQDLAPTVYEYMVQGYILGYTNSTKECMIDNRHN